MREPFKHQIEASRFLASPDGHMLVGEMGTGKTFAAILAAVDMGAKNILVVAPPILLRNWSREFQLAGSEMEVAFGQPTLRQIKDAHVLVLSMDWMRSKRAVELALSRSWDLMIADEAQGLANPESKRTLATYSEKIKVGKVVQLTGTPTPKHAGQLWTHVNRTAPERIDGMDYEAFTRTYCTFVVRQYAGMRFPQEVIQGNNRLKIPDLRKRLAGWWLRQRKEDVLPNLPPRTINDVYVQGDKVDLKAVATEIDPEVLEHIEWAMEHGLFEELRHMSDGVATLRRLLARAKVPPVVDYVKALLDGGQECVAVWGWHTAALHEVQRQLGGKVTTGLIDGSVPDAARTRIVDDFQAGKTQVFLGQIKAAGVGITLTRTNRAVFIEHSFVPSDNAQAYDRHHRIGQHHPVQIDRMVLEHSIDEAVNRIIARRQHEFEELMQ